MVTTQLKTAADAQTEKRQELELHTAEHHSTKVNNKQRVTDKQPENNQTSRTSPENKSLKYRVQVII